jgi:transcriptional regulator with XRE-family HTH domain
MTGTQLRKARKRLGLSQAKLADALGVTANTVARWERGEMNIAQPQLVEAALHNLKEIESMSSYDRTMQLAREGNALALGLLKQCYEWVLKQGRDHDFAARWILGGIPVVNLRTLSALGAYLRRSAPRAEDIAPTIAWLIPMASAKPSARCASSDKKRQRLAASTHLT